ncbi:uncharacterized protein LOC125561769 [Nematostella vectensis]|uniref:uncharacterized protein LOC125561769 n=1 Tax=Nematostella vectensis TaxID=45351 RepID=UPI002076E477|nr:uncharacterized protein LOC125561769 [Nematostella vectensis]
MSPREDIGGGGKWGLAGYLGDGEHLKIGEQGFLELLRDGFGETPLFHCLVAEEVRHKEGSLRGVTFIFQFGPIILYSFINHSTRKRMRAHTVDVTKVDVTDRGAIKEMLLGVAIYFFTYSTWEGPMLYLEDLFVIPLVRGRCSTEGRERGDVLLYMRGTHALFEIFFFRLRSCGVC